MLAHIVKEDGTLFELEKAPKETSKSSFEIVYGT